MTPATPAPPASRPTDSTRVPLASSDKQRRMSRQAQAHPSGITAHIRAVDVLRRHRLLLRLLPADTLVVRRTTCRADRVH
ncbi:hypothetical protein JG688_00015742 [Phytophthora aleatoria]|uniref:Uncharacterized protein n=1 Tax=Phytophthora aleatoria TaxID=2496075 RepID=A0A8J5IJI7_9STRA|nr:hypothetical protein JG688_00015742 [Phytophthora aleatoria]